MIADVSCYSHEYMDASTEAICGQFDDDATNAATCSAAGDSCGECTSTAQLDGKSCTWFDGFCGHECGMMGCGVTTCEGDGDGTDGDGDGTDGDGDGTDDEGLLMCRPNTCCHPTECTKTGETGCEDMACTEEYLENTIETCSYDVAEDSCYGMTFEGNRVPSAAEKPPVCVPNKCCHPTECTKDGETGCEDVMCTEIFLVGTIKDCFYYDRTDTCYGITFEDTQVPAELPESCSGCCPEGAACVAPDPPCCVFNDPSDENHPCWSGDMGCLECTRLGCGWAGGCMPSCDMIADVSCYSKREAGDTSESVCTLASNDAIDAANCSSKSDCSSCVDTLKLDGEGCRWYDVSGSGFCSTGDGYLPGPGATQCSEEPEKECSLNSCCNAQSCVLSDAALDCTTTLCADGPNDDDIVACAYKASTNTCEGMTLSEYLESGDYADDWFNWGGAAGRLHISALLGLAVLLVASLMIV
jgi:hypothetical protein